MTTTTTADRGNLRQNGCWGFYVAINRRRYASLFLVGGGAGSIAGFGVPQTLEDSLSGEGGVYTNSRSTIGAPLGSSPWVPYPRLPYRMPPLYGGGVG
eukprot:7807671-Pyramimonas_sp.AAC.1